jgi:hypothetical protein
MMRMIRDGWHLLLIQSDSCRRISIISTPVAASSPSASSLLHHLCLTYTMYTNKHGIPSFRVSVSLR